MSSVGAMRHRVQIVNKIRTDDGYGGFTETTTTIATVWADVRQLSSGEVFRRQHLDDSATHSIRIRYRTDVTTEQQIIYAGRTFAIRATKDEDERHRFLVLTCEEGIEP